MSLTYFLNDFEIVPVAPIITGITLLLHSTCTVFPLGGFYILKSSWLIFLLHFCLLKLPHLLKCMFPFHCLGL
jgi:hypothetical protein